MVQALDLSHLSTPERPKRLPRTVDNARSYINSVRKMPKGTVMSESGYQELLLDGAEYLPCVIERLDDVEDRFEKMRARFEYWMETAIKLCPAEKRPWLEDVRDVDRARLGIEEVSE